MGRMGWMLILFIAVFALSSSNAEAYGICSWGDYYVGDEVYATCMNPGPCYGALPADECQTDSQCDPGYACLYDLSTSCCYYGQQPGAIYDSGICHAKKTCQPTGGCPSGQIMCTNGCQDPVTVRDPCDDENACTVNDEYVDECGACIGSPAPPNCDSASSHACGVEYPDYCGNTCEGTGCGTPSCSVSSQTTCNTATDTCEYTCWGQYNGATCIRPTDCQTGPAWNGAACVNTNKPAGTACSDDGNPCTTDVCSSTGTCTHPDVEDGTVVPGGYCSNGEVVTCITNAHCADDADACTDARCINPGTTSSACTQVTDYTNAGCTGCAIDSHCTDGDSCTRDSCYLNSCYHDPEIAVCDDPDDYACGTTISPTNGCGACATGTACSGGRTCDGSSCNCPSGTTWSGSACLETMCADGVDNDGNGRADYDGFTNGAVNPETRGDPNCKVCLSSTPTISGGTSANTVRSGSSFTLSCPVNGGTIKGVDAVFSHGGCTFTSWSGTTARFSCTANNVASTTTATIGCQLNTTKLTLTTSCVNPQTRSITINPSSCTGVSQAQCGGTNTPECAWYPMCSGVKSSGVAGYCGPIASPPTYICRGTSGALQCGAGCSSQTTCYGGNGYCDLNTCSCVCNAGSTLCSGACVTTGTDKNNCGACGVVCQNNQVCNAGSCACPAGTVLSGSTCVEAVCNDRIDNDGNDEYDYDGSGNATLGLKHGDLRCPVSVSNLVAPNVIAGQTFTVTCNANARVRSIGVNVTGPGVTNTECEWTSWSGVATRRFSCPAFSGLGSYTATCFVDPSESYQQGNNISVTRTVSCPANSVLLGGACVSCDADSDGFNNLTLAGCSARLDCNDANSSIHPGASLVCGNGVAEDCGTCDPHCSMTWSGQLQNIYGEGIAGSVRFDNQATYYATDSAGNFNVPAVGVGYHDLSGNASGYETVTINDIYFACNDPTYVNITLPEAQCKSDCTLEGVCRYDQCLGVNGCTVSGSDADEIIDVCLFAEEGANRELNSTHSVICCRGPVRATSEFQSPLTIQGCSENLITLSKVVNYQGKILTMEVVTYNKCE